MDNRFILYGRPFIMITDHMNLTYLVDSESDKVQRWKASLQQFTITFIHAPGVTIPEPDLLSRT
jgi:hypothetical protein